MNYLDILTVHIPPYYHSSYYNYPVLILLLAVLLVIELSLSSQPLALDVIKLEVIKISLYQNHVSFLIYNVLFFLRKNTNF